MKKIYWIFVRLDYMRYSWQFPQHIMLVFPHPKHTHNTMQDSSCTRVQPFRSSVDIITLPAKHSVLYPLLLLGEPWQRKPTCQNKDPHLFLEARI